MIVMTVSDRIGRIQRMLRTVFPFDVEQDALDCDSSSRRFLLIIRGLLISNTEAQLTRPHLAIHPPSPVDYPSLIMNCEAYRLARRATILVRFDSRYF